MRFGRRKPGGVRHRDEEVGAGPGYLERFEPFKRLEPFKSFKAFKP
jgi:hypothetical protein